MLLGLENTGLQCKQIENLIIFLVESWAQGLFPTGYLPLKMFTYKFMNAGSFAHRIEYLG